MKPQHYLAEDDLGADGFREVLERAAKLKRAKQSGTRVESLAGRVLAMIFTKSSTRTRTSFEAGMAQLGGHAINLTPRDTQLGRGEPLPDTARVLSEMVDAVMIRNDSQQDQELFAQHANIPVINGLSETLHPCQSLADILTWQEHCGDITGRTAVWIGDGNNVCNSWINCARILNFQLRIAAPKGYLPDAHILAQAADHVALIDDPFAAAAGADLVTTDVWASMGQEEEHNARAEAFKDFQVTNALMQNADRNAIFLHCLPAHRGEEVAADVIDGPQSRVWAEAGNRLHAQKGLLEYLLLS